MFIESREKLKRRIRVKETPRSFGLQKRWKYEKMSYETRMKLLKLERKLPIVRTYNWDDYFPADQVAQWVGRTVDRFINLFFIFVISLALWAMFMNMGPSRMMIECLVNPMSVILEPYTFGDEEHLDKLTRIALVKDIFALG